MQSRLLASDETVARYFELFVNRGAYTVQSSVPDSETRRCHYYRPKGRISLSTETIRRHLEGHITIGLYAINPTTQRCKWVAVDADYPDALEDLLKRNGSYGRMELKQLWRSLAAVDVSGSLQPSRCSPAIEGYTFTAWLDG